MPGWTQASIVQSTPDLLATATNITGSNFGSSVKCVVHRINTFRCISLTVPHCFVTFRKRLEFEDFNRSALLARFLLVECAGPVQAPIKAVLPSVDTCLGISEVALLVTKFVFLRLFWRGPETSSELVLRNHEERAVAEPPLQPAGFRGGRFTFAGCKDPSWPALMKALGGIAGSTPIAFGGGAVMSERHFRDLRRQAMSKMPQKLRLTRATPSVYPKS